MRAELDAGYAPAPGALDAMVSRRWTLGFFGTLRVVTARQLLLLRMDAALVRQRLVQVGGFWGLVRQLLVQVGGFGGFLGAAEVTGSGWVRRDTRGEPSLGGGH
jgi:hypothetical protein